MTTKHEQESLDFTYDVFVSFRGEDIRYTFMGYLRDELSGRGICTFFDDRDLKLAQGISPSLSDAIDESKILIVLFSENYASSTWCLDELVKILECSSRNKKQLVFPIFYHVDPSDIRHQRNSYGEHMITQENKFGKDSQKVKDWRAALSEACNLPGHYIATGSNKYEIDSIKKIVEKIHKNIAPKPLHDGQNRVGLEPRIEEVMPLLDMESDDVRMLGIHGLGGIGKTELAKALYNKIVQRFDAACFLENVREKSNTSKGLEDLQKTLLSEMFEDLQNELGSSSRGKSEINRRLRKKKVLLVLDDVDDKDKLEKLAGERDWFGKGSRIIITTRDKDLLMAHEVKEMYEMKELDEQHSLELFCWNAFKQSEPKAGFEKVSLRAAGFAKRLPLALKVIGSDLGTEETLDDWESVLKEYDDGRNRLNEKIHNVLKISYDRLGRKPKQVFLDIACFFKGEKKEYVENILGAASSIRLLCKKSLLMIEGGFLKMHDLIQDMGREIVEQEAENPGKRSRLWYHRDVIRVLNEDLGTDEIQGIMLDPPQGEVLGLSGSAFEKMKCLRILIIRKTSFQNEPGPLPNSLRVLDWEEYPSKSFPPKFYPEDIIILNLPISRLTLHEPFKKFSCLIHMDLSDNQSITEIPDVSKLENLRELRLDRCANLIAVHQSVGFLTKLAHLRVSTCRKLKSFLRQMFLPSLEVLNLNFCESLELFPEITEEIKNPLKIYMVDTGIKKLPESIGNLTGLIFIDMSNSMKLEYIPSSFFMLPNVVDFITGGCSQLRESFRSFLQSPSMVNFRPEIRRLNCENNGLSDEDLSMILHGFPKLEELIASKNNFVSLAAFRKECVHLTSLDVSFCQTLKKIREIECTNLRILNVAGCGNLEEISELPSTIHKVDARYCFNLTAETLSELWCQAAKEIGGLEVVMPAVKEMLDCFHWRDDGGNPKFWSRRGKFPNFALALLFEHDSEIADTYFLGNRHPFALDLVINGRRVPRKGYYYSSVSADHVLICDMRLVFSDKEQLGLDALFVEHEWNLVQFSCEAPSSLKISCWGVYVRPDENETNYNLDDVIKFTCPDPGYSYKTQVPTEEVDPRTQRRRIIEKSCLGELVDFMMMAGEWLKRNPYFKEKMALKENFEEGLYSTIAFIKELSTQAKDELHSEDSALENKMSTLTSLVDALNFAGFQIPEPGNFSTFNQFVCEMSKEETDEVFDQMKKLGMLFEGKMNGADKATKLEWDPLQLGMLYEGKMNGADKATFPRFTDSVNSEAEAEHENLCHKVVGEASASKEQDSDPQLGKLTRKEILFYHGVTDGLVEAQKRFPSLDINQTRSAALNKGSLDSSHFELLPVLAEFKEYFKGLFIGLFEAKLSCPNLQILEMMMVCGEPKLTKFLREKK